VLGTGRDLAELQGQLRQRAREVWSAIPRASYERTGLRTWDFDALPASVAVDAGGRRVQAYPALVETDNGVDLRLLESPGAATAALRDGLRRLFMIELGYSPSKLDAMLPSALDKSLRRPLAQRALDETFGLTSDPASLPRDRAAYAARVAAGKPRFSMILTGLAAQAVELVTELAKVQASIRPLAGKPGLLRAVYEDVESQLRHLAPATLLQTASGARLAHVPRYIRALQVRLQRQAHDPQKDQQKATQVVPLWQTFLARSEELRKKGRTTEELDEFAWLVEELRVHVFAPELKTAVSISPARAQEIFATLAR